MKNRTILPWSLLVIISLLLAPLSGCREAEEAGHETEEALEETADAVQDTAEKAADKIEDATDELDQEM
ncbi:hypothetical protein P4C99_03645 [Pontiellaceae bacterium B1224]|nr:hypothetical protein [Pontiellaceae bacterium B1224]